MCAKKNNSTTYITKVTYVDVSALLSIFMEDKCHDNFMTREAELYGIKRDDQILQVHQNGALNSLPSRVTALSGVSNSVTKHDKTSFV